MIENQIITLGCVYSTGQMYMHGSSHILIDCAVLVASFAICTIHCIFDDCRCCCCCCVGCGSADIGIDGVFTMEI